MVIGLHEIVDGEVILSVVEAGAASDDLFELDDGVDGAHQDDVADVGVGLAGPHCGERRPRSNVVQNFLR